MFEERSTDDFLTIAELALWLRLTKRTIENYRQHYPELLPPSVILPKRAVRYRVGKVRDWLSKNEKYKKEK